MTREEVIRIAKHWGWKPWGKLRSYENGSKYQCFRINNRYCWIGLHYVEFDQEAESYDFINNGNAVELTYLMKWKYSCKRERK